MLIHADLLSLPACRELDALVAEQVMGCVVKWIEHPLGRYAECGCKDFPHTRSRQEPDSPWGGLSEYSTSIAAAWEVLEHLKPTLNFVLFYYGEQHPVRTTTNPDAQRPAFCCEIHPGLYVGRANTAPLAICRAALKAVQHG